MARRTKSKGVASGEAIGRKLLQSVREMKAAQRGRVTSVELNEVSQARQKSGLWGATIILSGITTIILSGAEESKAA